MWRGGVELVVYYQCNFCAVFCFWFSVRFCLHVHVAMSTVFPERIELQFLQSGISHMFKRQLL